MGHKSLKMFFEGCARRIDRAGKVSEKAHMEAATVGPAKGPSRSAGTRNTLTKLITASCRRPEVRGRQHQNAQHK
jgi:hypothetical protein